jgi:peptidoglycan/xylan/chitin deacetylase (PgdA/CDA1 family)
MSFHRYAAVPTVLSCLPMGSGRGMLQAKAVARRMLLPALSGTGSLAMFHRARNRHALTVVGLHRVLSPGDPRFAFAMPMWTITAGLFEGLLEFLCRSYNPVSLDAVVRSAASGAPLPPRAMLLTFDDGWADTEDTALPLMRRAGVPGAVFVASSRLGSREGFWDSEWHASLMQATANERAHVWRTLRPGRQVPGTTPELIDGCLRALRAHPLARRWRLLGELRGGPVDQGGALMLRPDQLGTLLSGGVEIGAHGVTHEPLAGDDAGLGEVRESIATLAHAVRPFGGSVSSLSYPHGSYDSALVRSASAAGAALQFTSDSVLVPAPGGVPHGPVMGRVWIVQSSQDRQGRFDRSTGAWELFRYPHERLSGERRPLPFRPVDD